jgi:hypothetical protein
LPTRGFIFDAATIFLKRGKPFFTRNLLLVEIARSLQFFAFCHRRFELLENALEVDPVWRRMRFAIALTHAFTLNYLPLSTTAYSISQIGCRVEGADLRGDLDDLPPVFGQEIAINLSD